MRQNKKQQRSAHATRAPRDSPRDATRRTDSTPRLEGKAWLPMELTETARSAAPEEGQPLELDTCCSFFARGFLGSLGGSLYRIHSPFWGWRDVLFFFSRFFLDSPVAALFFFSRCCWSLGYSAWKNAIATGDPGNFFHVCFRSMWLIFPWLDPKYLDHQFRIAGNPASVTGF